MTARALGATAGTAVLAFVTIGLGAPYRLVLAALFLASAVLAAYGHLRGATVAAAAGALALVAWLAVLSRLE